jgi:cobalt-precorrin 5A hydrolase
MRVAGLGFRSGATIASLRAVLLALEARGGPAEALACLPDKAGAAALRALAAERGLPLHAVAVDGVATATQSARIMALHNTGSVAEAAALVAAGPLAQLTVTRINSPDGTVTGAMAHHESEET